MAKYPYIQFFTGDWLKDPHLSLCSSTTRGIWIDMLCAMHENDRTGVIEGTPEQLARLCRCTADEISAAVDELKMTKTADVNIIGTTLKIVNRRMVREYKINNGATIRMRRLREKGGGDPARWAAIRVPILERDKYICAYCGRKADTVDHIIPKSKGGDESPTNLVACCKRCNMLKSIRTMDEAGMSFWLGFDKAILERYTNVTPGITPHIHISSSNSSSNSKDIPPNPPEGGTPLPKKERKNREPKEVVYSKSFDLFWKEYPTSMRKAKGKAYEAWQKIPKKYPGIKTADITIALIHQVKNNHFTGKKDGQDYTPLPSTWLNDSRWEDAVTECRGKSDKLNILT